MKRVHYAGGIFVTSDAIGAELLQYATDLANSEREATVEVPGLHEDGSSDRFMFVLGPASQIMLDSDPHGLPFATDEAVVRLEQEQITVVPPQGRRQYSLGDPSHIDEL